MAITALELQGRLVGPGSRHLRVVRRSPRPGGALADSSSRGAGASVGRARADGEAGRVAAPRATAPLAGPPVLPVLPVLAGLPRGVRRAAAGVLAAAVLLVGAGLGLASTPAPSGDGVAVGGVQRTVVVAPGQSVWDVAAAQSPGTVEAYAAAVLALNGLDSAAIPSGTVLQLPEG